MARKGQRALFFTGGTSACRTHIRQHYPLYSKLCQEKGIAEHHFAVPRDLARMRKKAEDEKNGRSTNGSGQLTAMGFEPQAPTMGPVEFSKESILEHTAKYVVCTDQVSV